MDKKTIGDFQRAAAKKRPDMWIIDRCSLCNAGRGFVFCSDYIRVGYDHRCKCEDILHYVTECKWSDLTEIYNRQTHPNVIKEMNEFWGFIE